MSRVPVRRTPINADEPDGKQFVEFYCCDYWQEGGRFTNTCDRCGDDYNSAGQRLAPREQWGEETGESAADILSVDQDVGEE